MITVVESNGWKGDVCTCICKVSFTLNSFNDIDRFKCSD